MRLGKGRGTEACCNVRAAVDGEPELIIATGGTSAPGDRDRLRPMALQAKEALGRTLEAVAAVGSDHGEGVKTCPAAGITP